MDRRAPGTSRRMLPVLTGRESVVEWTGLRGRLPSRCGKRPPVWSIESSSWLSSAEPALARIPRKEAEPLAQRLAIGGQQRPALRVEPQPLHRAPVQVLAAVAGAPVPGPVDRKSTRLNSSHPSISYAV